MAVLLKRKAFAEEWRPVARNDRYEVSNRGRVRVVKPYHNQYMNRVIVGAVDKHGYHCVDLHAGNSFKRVRSHRLVAEAFLGQCPEGQEVRHLDGNKLNNDLRNLAYGTRSDNMQDAKRHGTAYYQPAGWQHSDEAREKIAVASRRMWEKRRAKAAA